MVERNMLTVRIKGIAAFRYQFGFDFPDSLKESEEMMNTRFYNKKNIGLFLERR